MSEYIQSYGGGHCLRVSEYVQSYRGGHGGRGGRGVTRGAEERRLEGGAGLDRQVEAAGEGALRRGVWRGRSDARGARLLLHVLHLQHKAGSGLRGRLLRGLGGLLQAAAPVQVLLLSRRRCGLRGSRSSRSHDRHNRLWKGLQRRSRGSRGSRSHDRHSRLWNGLRGNNRSSRSRPALRQMARLVGMKGSLILGSAVAVVIVRTARPRPRLRSP